MLCESLFKFAQHFLLVNRIDFLLDFSDLLSWAIYLIFDFLHLFLRSFHCFLFFFVDLLFHVFVFLGRDFEGPTWDILQVSFDLLHFFLFLRFKFCIIRVIFGLFFFRVVFIHLRNRRSCMPLPKLYAFLLSRLGRSLIIFWGSVWKFFDLRGVLSGSVARYFLTVFDFLLLGTLIIRVLGIWILLLIVCGLVLILILNLTVFLHALGQAFGHLLFFLLKHSLTIYLPLINKIPHVFLDFILLMHNLLLRVLTPHITN